MCDSTQGSFYPSPMKICQSTWIQWPFFSKAWIKCHWPLDDLWPQVCWGHMCESTQGSVSKSHENTSKYVDTVTFFKNLNQRLLTPRWPLTPRMLRSHVWLYPRFIVSKFHGNTSMYVDTVINFAKKKHIYYVHTTYVLHTECVIT